MLTTTHILIGASVTTRPWLRPVHILWGWLGGFAPDASVVAMVGVSRLAALENGGVELWDAPHGLYWQEPWQTFSAISNSIPMWALLALIGFFVSRRFARFRDWGLGLAIFASAALIHTLCDFPVHTDDAHVHFWPFTEWRFHSMVSYYRSSEYGNLFRPFEMVLNVALAAYLVWRFPQWPVRVMAVLFAVTPFAMRYLARMMF